MPNDNKGPGSVPMKQQGKKPVANPHAMMTDRAKKLLQAYENIKKSMSNQGLPATIAEYVAYQALHETGGMASKVAKQNNNYSGIKFINNPKLQKATKGLKSPEGNFYAHFPDTAAWAADHARIIKKGPGYPIQATSLEDFAKRLKANRYYGDSVANYTRALQKWADMYKGYKSAEKGVQEEKIHYDKKHQQYMKDKEHSEKWKQFWKDHWGKVAIGVGGLFLISRLTK